MREVVITGVGVISALGKDWSSFKDNVKAGKSALKQRVFSIRDLPDFEAVVGTIPDFDPDRDIPNCKTATLDRSSQLTVFAARQALAQSGLKGADIDELMIGIASMGLTTIESGYDKLFRGNRRIPPLNIPKQMVNAPAAQVSIDLGIFGPSYAIGGACSSTNQAISLGAAHIAAGLADRVMVGGVEATMPYSSVWSWKQMGVMSNTACRPFCSTRSGLSLGEGAGVFVLESAESAAERDAHVLAKICGVGNNSDANSITKPTKDRIALAIEKTLSAAGWDPTEVDYINAHGTGTAANDATEAEALFQVFGDALPKVSVSSSKSLHGHLLSASGAVEMAVTLAAIETQIVPPTANIEKVDDLFGLDPTPGEPRPRKILRALTNSFAFGGHNSVIAVQAV